MLNILILYDILQMFITTYEVFHIPIGFLCTIN